MLHQLRVHGFRSLDMWEARTDGAWKAFMAAS